MYVGLSKEHEALRDELRAYYDELLTPEVEEDLRKGEGVGQVSKDTWKKMAADGYAGVGWPKEWGGKGLTPIEQFVFFDESMRAGAPVPMLTINSVAPTIMRYGSEEQKQFYVAEDPEGRDPLRDRLHRARRGHRPRVAEDERRARRRRVHHQRAEGVHEPRERLRLHLARGAHQPGGRRSTRASRSSSCPPTRPASATCRSTTSAHTNTNITYYEDVRVPVGNLVGEENGGWSLITNQLNHERVTLCSSGVVERMLDDVRAWAQETKLADGRRVIDQEWVQINLGRVHAKLEFLRLANWRVAWLAQSGAALNPADASTIKVYGTEFYMEAARLLMEVMRDQAPLQGDSPGAVLRGRVERMLRGDAHPHLRRRHQRDAARPDLDLRAQHARQPALIDGSTRSTHDGLFPHRERKRSSRGLAARILEDRIRTSST